MRMRALLVLVAILISASGCVVGPNFRPPTTPVPDAWHQQLQDGTFLDVQGVRQWWMIFDDPTLDSLMQQVADQNLDLIAAFQRICQARERVNITRSARLLQLDKTGTFSHAQTQIIIPGFAGFVSRLREIDFWTSDLDASWEPVVF